MSRPKTIDDLPEARRTVQIATFCPVDFITDAEMTKRYAAFIDLVQLRGGVAEGSTHVTVSRPATKTELADHLRSEQVGWDHRQKLYEQWRSQGTTGMADWQVSTAKRHAETEGLDWIEDPAAEPVA